MAATPKSRRNLQEKLRERGFAQTAIQGALEQLEKQGLLNDRSFAESIFQTYSNHRFSGRRRIAFELEKRGISKPLVREILEKFTPEDEREKALELAKQKQEKWSGLDRLKRRKKIYDFLVRRGFDFTLSRDVVAEVERENE